MFVRHPLDATDQSAERRMIMANRFKKLIKPILDEECVEAFKRGFEEGKQAGWDKRVIAYENEIEFLKNIIRGLTNK